MIERSAKKSKYMSIKRNMVRMEYGTRAREQNVDSMFVVMIVIFRFAAKQVYLSLALLVGDE